MTHEFPLNVTASWERSLVDANGDDTALVVTIRATTDRDQSHNHNHHRQRTPIDVAFVLDHSGSMSGEKLTLVKEAVNVALDHLSNQDRAALVIFDSSVDTLHPLDAVTEDTKASIRRRLARVEANASTNLSGGWLTGCQELATISRNESSGTRPKRALLLTDGLANEGITEPHNLTKHATELRLRGITTTAIGVGHGFDEMLLSGMTEAGGGTFQYIAHPRELSAFFAKEINDLIAITATSPKLRLTLPDGIHAHLVNAFPAHRAGKTITVDLRDLAAGDEINLVFDIRTAPGQVGTSLRPTIKLSWTDAGTHARTRFSQEIDVLVRASSQDVKDAPTNESARAVVALERAGRSQRDAIELDRQGRYRESRAAFNAGYTNLMAAPETDAILAERRITYNLAAAPMAPLNEETRKERVHARM
ncbi:MAG: vWA domain-containing protein, partial [Thermomicrobiales bacterium]